MEQQSIACPVCTLNVFQLFPIAVGSTSFGILVEHIRGVGLKLCTCTTDA